MRGGQFQATGFLVEVGQVLIDSGIGFLPLCSTQQVLFRSVVFSQLEIGPTQRIQIRSVGGLEVDCLLDVGQRLFQPHAAVGQHVAEVVERIAVLRLGREDLLERIFRLVVLLLVLEDRPGHKIHVDLFFRLH